MSGKLERGGGFLEEEAFLVDPFFLELEEEADADEDPARGLPELFCFSCSLVTSEDDEEEEV